jgi:hypothetical protein
VRVTAEVGSFKVAVPDRSVDLDRALVGGSGFVETTGQVEDGR